MNLMRNFLAAFAACVCLIATAHATPITYTFAFGGTNAVLVARDAAQRL